MTCSRLLFSAFLALIYLVISTDGFAADTKHDGFKWFEVPDEILAGIGETLDQPATLQNQYISTDDLKNLVLDKQEIIAKRNMVKSQNSLTKLNKILKKRGQNSKAGKKILKNYHKELKKFKKIQNNYRKIKLSNSQIRLNKVNKFNKNIKIIGKTSKGVILKYGSVALSITDGGSKIAGRFYEGDYSGGSAVMIDEAAKAGTSTIGVYSGGVFGATAGTFIGGPPGALIGGAIGAIGGAVASSSAYNYFVGKKLHKLSEHYLKSVPELTPLEQAKKSRKEHIEENKRQDNLKLEVERMADEDIKVTDFWATTDNLGEQGVSLKSDFPSSEELLDTFKTQEYPADRNKKKAASKKKGTGESTHKKKINQQKKDFERKADRMIAQGGISTETVHGGTPVIPLNCTINIIAWPQGKPEHRFDYSLDVRDGNVSGAYSYTMPAKDYSRKGVNKYCSAWTMMFRTTGTLDGNIIRSVTLDNGEGALKCYETGTRHMQVGEGYAEQPYTCDSVYRTPSRSTSLTALNVDGTLTETVTTTSEPQITVSGHNCVWDTGSNKKAWEEAGAYNPVTTTLVGLWEIRK